MATSLARKNVFSITGILKDVVVKDGNGSNGQPNVSVTATVTGNLDGKLNEFTVRFFSGMYKASQDGKQEVSKLYTSYKEMGNLIGKKVQIDGDIRESRFANNKGELVSGNQLNGKFIKAVADSSVDSATYELSGFIAIELTDKTNKNNEVYRHDLKLGQSNYNGDMASIFTLHVDPVDKDIVNGVRGYRAGDTVKVTGQIRFYSEQKEIIDDSNAFGGSRTKTITNAYKYFYVDGGSNPFKRDDEGFYDSASIRELIGAYQAHDIELASGAKNKAEVQPVVEQAPVTSRQTSLL